MNKKILEYVEGLTKHHETMWIEREEGKIKQLYDIDLNPIETTMLYKSFIVEFTNKGFSYKGEFIPMEDALSVYKKRALGNQRRRSGHYFKNEML